MSRRSSLFWVGLLLGIFGSTIAFAFFLRKEKTGGNQSAQQEQMVLKLGHGLDTSHPVHKSMEYMKERLEELSGGTVTIDIYPSSVLGSETQCIEQLQYGSLAMTKTSVASMENFIPEMAVFSLPYVFRSSEHYWEVLHGLLGQRLLEKGKSKYLLGLCYYDAGSRNFYTSQKPIRSPKDLKGLKIRVMQSATSMQMIEAFEASPTPIDWGELYSSLAQGTVDGAENNLPSFTTNKHYEVAHYFTRNAHTRIPDMLLISTKVWDKLSPQAQGWIQQAAKESSDYERKLWDEKTTEALEDAKAHNVEVIDVDVDAFAEKVRPMYDLIENQNVKELLKEIQEVKP